MADDGEVDVAGVVTAFASLLRASDSVVDVVCRTLHINASDARAIVYIASNEASTPKALAEYLELTTGAITSMVDRLDVAGFVRRVRNPNDRRSSVIELAPAGADAVARIDAFYRSAFREAVDPNYLDFLASSLRAIEDSLVRAATRGMDADTTAATDAERGARTPAQPDADVTP